MSLTRNRADVRMGDTLAGLLPPQTVALLGDSITWYNGPGGLYDDPVAIPYSNAQGFWTWANASLGGRMILLRQAGVAGNRTDQVLARIDDILDLPETPGFCVVMAGANDVLQDKTSTEIITNLEAIYTALRAKGIVVVACTILPIWTTNPARWASQCEANDWIRARAQQPGFVLADAGGRWADASSGGARTGLTFDGVHPTVLGAGAVGKVVADAMRPYVGGSISLPAMNTDPTNILTNGMMLGTAGTITGGHGTGSLASSWSFGRSSGAGTMTLAKVARTDSLAGEWQSLTFAGGGGTFIMWQDATPAGLALGHKYRTEMEFDSGVFTGMTRFQLAVATIGGSVGAYALNQLPSQGQPYPTDVTGGVVRTPVWEVAGAFTGIQTSIVFEGTSGSVRIGRIRTRRVA